METENIVALCDADWERAARTFAKYPNAPRYKDFRVMLEKQGKDIDAVTVGTPTISTPWPPWPPSSWASTSSSRSRSRTTSTKPGEC